MSEVNDDVTRNVVRSKGWFLTYPQCAAEKEDLLSFLKSFPDFSRSVVAREKHLDGSFHLHAFVAFSKRKSCNGKTFDFQGYHGNYQSAKSPKAVYRYCTKGGDFIQEGIFSVNQHIKLSNSDMLNANLEEELAKGSISAQTYLTWIKARNEYKVNSLETDPSPNVKGIWLWGPPGTGKSHYAREFAAKYFNSVYLKPTNNQWWPGYKGEEAVIMDDFSFPGLGSHLKLWADKYVQKADVKGHHCVLCHKVFIITSNYSIEEVFKPSEDLNLYNAIKRRFFVKKMTDVRPESILPDGGVFDEERYVQRMKLVKKE